MQRFSRRALLRGTLLLAAAGPLGGCRLPFGRSEPPPRFATVGYLAVSNPRGAPEKLQAFRAGLADLNYVELKHFNLESYSADGSPRELPALAQRLLRRGPDVVLVGGDEAAATLRDLAAELPVIMAEVEDPVGLGLVTSLERPGGSFTGLTLDAPRLGTLWVELLHETVPGLERLAVLVNPDVPLAVLQLAQAQAAAQPLGIQLEPLEVRRSTELGAALERAGLFLPQAILLLAAAVFTAQQAEIAAFAARLRVPSLYQRRSFVDQGGLLAHGPSVPDLYRRAATYYDKILRGAAAADLPVEGPTKYDLAINTTVASELGLTLSEAVLKRATETI